jgi:hypothetical protein
MKVSRLIGFETAELGTRFLDLQIAQISNAMTSQAGV